MARENENVKYLGDGVYALFNGDGVVLHNNDLNDPTDRIYLKPKVIGMLNTVFKDWKGKASDGK